MNKPEELLKGIHIATDHDRHEILMAMRGYAMQCLDYVAKKYPLTKVAIEEAKNDFDCDGLCYPDAYGICVFCQRSFLSNNSL